MQRTSSTVRARLLASSMITGVALAISASAAGAQTTTAPTTPPQANDTGATQVQEFVVTGSRIPQPNLTSVSPVTAINAQEVKLEGTTNVEDLINNLPQAFADFGQFESNAATGTATVDLRGLGNTRTLVLIDGKRLQPGDITEPVADLNMIPPSLIERVEVLTGGASAVYGSDAVAGVVNFIMKKNFEGIQIDAETSIGEHDNNDQQVRNANALGAKSLGFPSLTFPSGSVWAGQRHSVTITGGANSADGKGNVEFYLGYTSIDPVLESKYDWSSCALATNTSNSKQQYCSGSVGTTAAGRLLPLTGPNAGFSYTILGAPVNGTLPLFTNAQAYNFAPLNYIQRPDTRYQAGEFSHYEINPAIDLYSSFMFLDDNTVSLVAPSGSFFGDNTYTVPCNDPLLSAAQANTLCGPGPYTAGQNASADIGRRDVEGGGRTSQFEHTDYRIVFGSKGDLGQGWRYDVSMQYGRSLFSSYTGGYFLNSTLINAIDVVPNPATGGVSGVAVGAPVCAAALVGGTASGCVPYNIWSPGGVTPAALAYLSGDANASGVNTEQVVTGSLSGDLGQYGVKSPFATDGVGISVGAEYRREYLQTNFDTLIQDGDLAGTGGKTLNTEGSQSDKDVFGEVRVPLAQGLPLVESLVLETGYRYSDYTSGGGNNTYKFGGDWQIVPDLRLRASFERAVRAPNVSELYTADVPGLVGATDPCADPVPGFLPQLSPQQCVNTFQHSFPGITLAQYENGGYKLPNGTILGPLYGLTPSCPAAQCGNFTGGNPDLKPESADTVSFGFVFTPTFFHGFSLTLDYFNIKVNKAILDLNANTILNNCALLNNAFDCSLIDRNPNLLGAVFGGIGEGTIIQPLINSGSLSTKGVDIDSSYRVALRDWHMPDLGSLAFNFTGTYLESLKQVLPDGTSFDCAGLYGVSCTTPSPRWRHQFRTTWITPWNVTVSLNWRFLSATRLDIDTNQTDLEVYEPFQGTPGSSTPSRDTFPSDARIPDFSYFDLSFTWKLKDRYTFRGGVNNIFDRTPPLLDQISYGVTSPAPGNGNTYPQVFDPLGRVLFLGVTADF